MQDFRKVVSDVRSSIAMDGHAHGDFLRTVAADYQAACAAANQRLARCVALVRRGKFSEALLLGDVAPNLLDVVALLDFPERRQWEQRIAQFGIAVPLPVDMAAAGELKAAYAKARPSAKPARKGVVQRPGAPPSAPLPPAPLPPVPARSAAPPSAPPPPPAAAELPRRQRPAATQPVASVPPPAPRQKSPVEHLPPPPPLPVDPQPPPLDKAVPQPPAARTWIVCAAVAIVVAAACLSGLTQFLASRGAQQPEESTELRASLAKRQKVELPPPVTPAGSKSPVTPAGSKSPVTFTGGGTSTGGSTTGGSTTGGTVTSTTTSDFGFDPTQGAAPWQHRSPPVPRIPGLGGSGSSVAVVRPPPPALPRGPQLPPVIELPPIEKTGAQEFCDFPSDWDLELLSWNSSRGGPRYTLERSAGAGEVTRQWNCTKYGKEVATFLLGSNNKLYFKWATNEPDAAHGLRYCALRVPQSRTTIRFTKAVIQEPFALVASLKPRQEVAPIELQFPLPDDMKLHVHIHRIDAPGFILGQPKEDRIELVNSRSPKYRLIIDAHANAAVANGQLSKGITVLLDPSLPPDDPLWKVDPRSRLDRIKGPQNLRWMDAYLTYEKVQSMQMEREIERTKKELESESDKSKRSFIKDKLDILTRNKKVVDDDLTEKKPFFDALVKLYDKKTDARVGMEIYVPVKDSRITLAFLGTPASDEPKPYPASVVAGRPVSDPLQKPPAPQARPDEPEVAVNDPWQPVAATKLPAVIELPSLEKAKPQELCEFQPDWDLELLSWSPAKGGPRFTLEKTAGDGDTARQWICRGKNIEVARLHVAGKKLVFHWKTEDPSAANGLRYCALRVPQVQTTVMLGKPFILEPYALATSLKPVPMELQDALPDDMELFVEVEKIDSTEFTLEQKKVRQKKIVQSSEDRAVLGPAGAQKPQRGTPVETIDEGRVELVYVKSPKYRLSLQASAMPVTMNNQRSKGIRVLLNAVVAPNDPLWQFKDEKSRLAKTKGSRNLRWIEQYMAESATLIAQVQREINKAKKEAESIKGDSTKGKFEWKIEQLTDKRLEIEKDLAEKKPFYTSLQELFDKKMNASARLVIYVPVQDNRVTVAVLGAAAP